MQKRKILSVVAVICIVLSMISMPGKGAISGATVPTLQVLNSQLIKGKSNNITVNLKNNDKTIAGIQFFVQFNTNAFSVKSVTSVMPEEWKLNWKESNSSTYGKGIMCMIQDSSLKGISDLSKNILKITLDDIGAQVNKDYTFKITIIDVCDEKGNSLSSSVASSDGVFTCVENPQVVISDDVNILGFQISHVLAGIRTISSAEQTIEGQNVVEYGNIYAITKDGVSDSDMVIGSESEYVAYYKATEQGVLEDKYGDSTTATNYVRTMTGNGTTGDAFTQGYKIRAYAKLADGSYVYSNVYQYSIYSVAKVLYDNKMMLNITGHEYLYNSILKTVDSSYEEVDFNWNNTVVKP